jgi:membrane protein YdbS with pleckstrin-like domain
MTDDQATAVIDPQADGAEATAAAEDGTTTATTEEASGSRLPGRPIQAAAAGAGIVVATGVLLAAIGRAGGKLELAPGESVLVSTRPRKVVWRYLATLGMWELARRSTRFTVTDQRIVIEEGIVARATRSVPLSRVGDVKVTTGLWQAFVDLSPTGRGGGTRETLGPLRNPVARKIAIAVSHAIAR